MGWVGNNGLEMKIGKSFAFPLPLLLWAAWIMGRKLCKTQTIALICDIYRAIPYSPNPR